jgi:hypothetical protein
MEPTVKERAVGKEVDGREKAVVKICLLLIWSFGVSTEPSSRAIE